MDLIYFKNKQNFETKKLCDLRFYGPAPSTLAVTAPFVDITISPSVTMHQGNRFPLTFDVLNFVFHRKQSMRNLICLKAHLSVINDKRESCH